MLRYTSISKLENIFEEKMQEKRHFCKFLAQSSFFKKGKEIKMYCCSFAFYFVF